MKLEDFLVSESKKVLKKEKEKRIWGTGSHMEQLAMATSKTTCVAEEITLVLGYTSN